MDMCGMDKENLFDESYEIVHEPNLALLASMIKIAKGPDRSMAEFAEACKVSASTLSRIANGKITRKLSVDLIQAIVKNSVEQREFDYSDIMEANGMVLESQKGESIRATRTKSGLLNERYNKRNVENTIKNILWMELSQKGIASSYLDDLPDGVFPKSKYGLDGLLRSLRLCGYPAFVIKTEGEKPEYWCSVIVVDYDSCFRCESVMMDFSPIFLMDAWEPECLEGVKISFIYNDRNNFDQFLNSINSAPVNSEMSVIYIDTEEQSFVEEVYINTCR